MARVEALRRRLDATAGVTLQQPLQVGQVKLFPKSLKVEVAGREPISLTPTEMHILRMLMMQSGKVVRREDLLEEIWNDEENNSNIVDVYIRRLRIKLEANPDKSQYIHSARGIGYKFLYEENSREPSTLTVEELNRVLDKIDNVEFLGESSLARLNIVDKQAQEIGQQPLERGLIVQRLLFDAIEELRPGDPDKDAAQLLIYQLLFLRYKKRMRNAEIAAQLMISLRHLFRERQRAIKELLDILLRKEMASKEATQLNADD